MTSIYFVIASLFICLLIIRYIILFVQFMLDEDPIWDKNIEKPRLLIYMIFGLSNFLLIRQIELSDGFGNLFYSFLFVFSCIIVAFSWNTSALLKFKSLMASAVSKNSYFEWKPIEFTDEQILLFYNECTRKEDPIIQGELSAFRNFVLNRKLGIFSRRLKWVYTGEATRKEINGNRSALLGFVLSINSLNTDNLINGQVNKTKYTFEIVKFMNEYFWIDEKTININSNIWSDPKINSVLSYKEMTDNILKNKGIK